MRARRRPRDSRSDAELAADGWSSSSAMDSVLPFVRTAAPPQPQPGAGIGSLAGGGAGSAAAAASAPAGSAAVGAGADGVTTSDALLHDLVVKITTLRRIAVTVRRRIELQARGGPEAEGATSAYKVKTVLLGALVLYALYMLVLRRAGAPLAERTGLFW